MLVCLVLESFSLEVVLSGHQDLVHKPPGCEIGLVVTVSIQPQKSKLVLWIPMNLDPDPNAGLMPQILKGKIQNNLIDFFKL